MSDQLAGIQGEGMLLSFPLYRCLSNLHRKRAFPEAHAHSAFQQVMKAKLCTGDTGLGPEVVYEIKRDLELKRALKGKDGSLESGLAGSMSGEASTKGKGKGSEDVDTDDSDQRGKKY